MNLPQRIQPGSVPHDDPRAADVMSGPNDVIAVFERPDLMEPLVRVIRQLNYAAVPGGELAAALSHGPGPTMRAAAAIVSDVVEEPLRLCASVLPGTPKILIASDASFPFRLAAARADVCAILNRPLNVSELSDWLEHFAAEQSLPVVSILIVDDDQITAEFHAELLRAAGMTATVVNSPVEALATVDTMLPDLVLMDVQMPEVDGIELARVIRQSRQYLTMPIVFLSAERDAGRQNEARKLGGDVFIRKPINPGQLVSMVRLRADRARTLRSLIERDSLTGLYNHGRFSDRLAHELERCRRSGAEISLVMIDIDHFKQINDSYGHPTGDRVIRALSALLTRSLRKIDIIGRYGGEEFGVILLDTPPPAARDVVDALRARFGDIPFEAAGRQFFAAFSAGIAGNVRGSSLPDLIGAADAALYAAKHGGRNRVALSGA